MKYAIVSIQWLSEQGLIAIPTMRTKLDGSEILVHAEILEPYQDANFPTYSFDSQELRTILSSDEWTRPEGEEPQVSPSTGFTQAAAAQNLLNVTKAGIQSVELTDDESLAVKSMYPQWSEFVGKPLTTGMKVQHNDKLWRVRQDISVVLQDQYPSIGTAALYEEINETHEGTLEDPIPYNNNMELFEGKYYIQNEAKYLCNRSTGQAVYQTLESLVGIYVQAVE